MIPHYKTAIPRRALRLLANLLVIGLIVGSFLSSDQKLKIGTHRRVEGRAGFVSTRHRLYHLAAFGLTSGAFLLLATSAKSEVLTAILMFGLGCAIETAQCLLAKVHLFEWWDIRDDFFGVATAFLMIQIVNSISRSMAHQRSRQCQAKTES